MCKIKKITLKAEENFNRKFFEDCLISQHNFPAMSDIEGKSYYKKTKPTYIYSIISIALVLFTLGMLGMIVIYAQKLSDYFKENIEISIILKDNLKEADIYQLQKKLGVERYVKSTDYVSKDSAAKRMSQEYNEDFIKLLEYNPLYASINIFLKSEYANEDSLKWIEKEISKNSQVKEIYYEKTLIEMVNKNVKKVGIVIIVISILLFFIAVTLIDNTIKLAVYSKRFLIKSMQLVGATRGFVTKPFITKSILNGLVSSAIAIAGLMGLLSYVQKEVPELSLLQDYIQFGLLFFSVVLIGIFISWFSTHRAVRKYLKMKLDELY